MVAVGILAEDNLHSYFLLARSAMTPADARQIKWLLNI